MFTTSKADPIAVQIMIKSSLRWFMRLVYKASLAGLSRGADIRRYYMYTQLKAHAAQRDPGHRVLSISHSERLCLLLGFSRSQVTDASYPEVNILNLPFGEATFDAVVSDQVLEHVEGDPRRAVDESFRVLKPGGLLLHTTCFINPIHEGPSDFWRFTPEALKLLVGQQGEIVEAGGWGNPYMWIFIAAGLVYEPIPDCRWHPAHWLATRNSPTWPATTWVLARKKVA